MRSVRGRLAQLVLGTALAVAAGVCRAAPLEPVVLAPDLETVPLAGHIEVLRDERGELTLSDVRSPAVAGQFVPSQANRFSHGLTHAAYWYRLALRLPANAGAQSGEWVLDLMHPALDLVDVHVIRPDGRIETILTGDTRPANPRQLDARTFAIPLHVDPGEEVSLYIRARNEGPLLVMANLWSEPAFQTHRARDNLWLGMFFGTLLVMILYNLIIGAWIRDRAYLYYVLTLISVFLIAAIQTGLARQYGDVLMRSSPSWLDAELPVVLACTNLFGALFTREFVAVRDRFPRLDMLYALAIWAWVVLLAISVLASYYWGTLLGLAGQAVFSTLTLLIGIYLSFKGVRAAQFLTLAWAGFLVGILLLVATAAGALPFTFMTLYGWQVGVALAVTVLALALADRIATERRERFRLSRLKQFFAPQVAEAILEEGGQALLAPQRREVTVLFTDLRGFTAFAAQAEPEEVVGVLREYHRAVAAAAEKHHGNVEQFTGDGVMVFFNAPVELPEHERCAVRMAFELRDVFAALSQAWRKRGYELGVGIGIATGFATVGAVGAEGRMGYSCTGTVTNLAARLCAQAQDGQVLASRTFLNRIEGMVAAEELGERELKGMPKPVSVCNLTQLGAASA